ncbi:MAG: DNA alkylation repair protein [Bacilli bacterium]|nr:DNA alkylation repair protein [Bacilli bacterium]MDD4406551.1 DNA alkylation repair protein [Bacilli bacterium]
MELIKDNWDVEDILEFQKFLKSYENREKIEWVTNLLKTELPVLNIKTAIIKNIVNNISKGNYLSFLDLMIWEYYENTAINGYLITKIKDFNTMKKYLDVYSAKTDNWATCDLLSFNIIGNEEKYFDLVLKYIKNPKPFVRRIGLSILFKFIDNNDYIDKIFNLLNNFKNEEHYYVNMMNAWLLCECFIKQREKTLKYLQQNKLNKFTINKGIQKCRESRRISLEDKKILLKYKIK